jgi:hypothetical protein
VSVWEWCLVGGLGCGGEGGLMSGFLFCGVYFIIRLKTGLCVSVYVSFIFSFFTQRLCM